MPVKKATRRKKTFAFWKPAKPAKRRRKTSRPPWWKTTPALAGATTCVMLLAVLIAVYQSGEPRSMLAARVAPAAATSLVESSTVAPAMPAPPTAPAEPAATPVKPNRVTITGCLERADEAFRLKDTEGEDAPKTRSWKSGFLKRNRSAVEVVDDGHRLNLSNHVGERVIVTGTLVDREIRVRTIERVAASCTIPPRVKV